MLHEWATDLIERLGLSEAVRRKDKAAVSAVLTSQPVEAKNLHGLITGANELGQGLALAWVAEIARQIRPVKPTRQVDPYWSLWGRLKSEYRRDAATDAECSDLEEPGINIYDQMAGEIAEERERERRVLLLPVRQVAVTWDGRNLVIDGRAKAVKDERHAVNTLRKLDTDDVYWAAFMRKIG